MIKYVVDVTEPLRGLEDPETGELTLVGGLSKRFTFTSEDDALIAFAKAAKAGFDVTFPRKVRSRARASA